jgi:hypothetical protein
MEPTYTPVAAFSTAVQPAKRSLKTALRALLGGAVWLILHPVTLFCCTCILIAIPPWAGSWNILEGGTAKRIATWEDNRNQNIYTFFRNKWKNRENTT